MWSRTLVGLTITNLGSASVVRCNEEVTSVVERALLSNYKCSIRINKKNSTFHCPKVGGWVYPQPKLVGFSLPALTDIPVNLAKLVHVHLGNVIPLVLLQMGAVDH